MSQRVSKSARKPILVLGLSLIALLFGGGYIARQAVFGHGRWHEIARGLYHQYKAAQMTSVYAAEVPAERADAPLIVYGDTLGAGWQDWSWATHDLKALAPVHSGAAAIVMSPKNNEGVYLHHDALGTTGYGALQFFFHGTAAINVCAVGGDAKFMAYIPLQKFSKPTAMAGWSQVRIPFAELGIPKLGGTITGIVFQTAGAAQQPPVAIDDIILLPDLSLPPTPTKATIAVSIDPGADRHPISPLIYGLAYAPADYFKDLHLSLNRWGGNDKSRYNWVLGNADNAARDWRFADRNADGNAPNGVPSSAADAFVTQNTLGGAATLLTVPTLGWVAKDADNGSASQNVPSGGGPPLAGVDGPIAGYDPTANRRLTSVRSLPRKGRPFTDAPTLADGVVYQDEWIHHLVKTFGAADAGGVQFYAMDNEPDLWDNTHTDVHPAQMGYDDLLKVFLDYADAVKDVDPKAQITGPVSWGWTGYEYSPLDRGSDNFHTHSDQGRHGGAWFLPWFLQQAHAHDMKTGRRSLDVLDIHYYPQAQGLYGGALDKDTQARRLRETRSLWDPAYTDESWIGQPVRLIPRMKEWVAQNYPGTKLGITEWNFGADGDINGALAIADVLGIYGREGLTLADYWAYPAKDSPGYLAFKLYRNADGAGHGFGDMGCRAVSADPNRLSCFAATDSHTGAVLMLVNKMPKATITVPLTLGGLPSQAMVKGYRLAADNPKQIVPLPSAAFTGAQFTETLPPYSITLLMISAKGGPAQ